MVLSIRLKCMTEKTRVLSKGKFTPGERGISFNGIPCSTWWGIRSNIICPRKMNYFLLFSELKWKFPVTFTIATEVPAGENSTLLTTIFILKIFSLMAQSRYRPSRPITLLCYWRWSRITSGHAGCVIEIRSIRLWPQVCARVGLCFWDQLLFLERDPD